MSTTASAAGRKARISQVAIRTTEKQHAMLRRAARLKKKSVAEFVLDSAYQAAERTLDMKEVSSVPPWMAFAGILNGDPDSSESVDSVVYGLEHP